MRDVAPHKQRSFSRIPVSWLLNLFAAVICAPESKLLNISYFLLHPLFATFLTAEENERENLVMGNECAEAEADESKCGFGFYWIIYHPFPIGG